MKDGAKDWKVQEKTLESNYQQKNEIKRGLNVVA